MTTTTATTRPHVNPNAIPAELRELDQWVTFQIEPAAPGKKPNKIPYTPGTRKRARSNDPRSWTSFAKALAATERSPHLHLGFCFTPELSMTFIDLDGVFDPDAGRVTDQDAAIVVDVLDSYTQVSASGRGVHVICQGRPPADIDWEKVGRRFEVYTGPRFCLLTGDVRAGLGGAAIEERTGALAALLPPREAIAPPRASRNGSQPTLTPDELSALRGALAPHRIEGQQHFLDLAIGGWLAKQGVPEEQATLLVAELSAGERKALSAVRDSYRNHAAGKEVKGFEDLRSLTDPATAAALDGIMARHREATRPKLVTPGRAQRLLTAQADEPDTGPDRWPAPPPEVYYGWFGGYLDLVQGTTEAPDQFHLAAALTMVGAYAGRSVHTRHASARIFPNLYTVLVGLSSESKKDTAIARACEAVKDPAWARERSIPPYVERYGVASAESFIKGLSNHANILVRMSEFSEILANARRKGTSTILTMLMKAWDTPPRLSNDSLTNPATVDNPYVTLLAGTQPDVLAGDLVGTDITSGFANRMLFVPGSGKARQPRPPEVDERALYEHWLRAKAHLRSYAYGEAVLPDWGDPRAVELWDAFYLAPRGESVLERTMSQRHQTILLKIALIFAMTDGTKAIELRHLEPALAFMEWEWECMQRLIATWATSNDNRLEERILRVLRLTGPIKRRDLQRRTKDPRWSSNDFARLVRSMLENGTLGIDDGLIGLRND